MSQVNKEKFIFNHPHYRKFWYYMRKTINEIHDELGKIIEKVKLCLESKIEDKTIIESLNNTLVKYYDYLQEEKKYTKSIFSEISCHRHNGKNLEDIAMLEEIINEKSIIDLAYVCSESFINTLTYLKENIINRLKTV